MNKGYVIEEAVAAVDARIEKYMVGAQNVVKNAFFNATRGLLPDGTYVKFIAMEKGNQTILTIDASSVSEIERIYGELFAEPKVEAVVEEKAEEKIEVKEEAPVEAAPTEPAAE